jgi:hypothetical protein
MVQIDKKICTCYTVDMPLTGEAKKAYAKKHYLENKEKYQQSVVRHKKRVLAKINALKDGPCIDCGQKFPAVCMDFDHVRGDKVADISTLAYTSTFEKVLEEIDKCELVCSNCHRIRTWKRLTT